MRWRRAIRRGLGIAGCLAVLGMPAGNAFAQGLPLPVLLGDPLDPATLTAYEILPDQPLVTSGPDGRLGSADDVIDDQVRGDIDLVVRVGADLAVDSIPEPAPQRGTVPVVTAGIRGVGTPLPFRVYASNGVVANGQPYGALIAAPDLEGLPVIVLAFADRDGDGFIGPVAGDPGVQVRQLVELDPVGREIAFFRDGIASGSLIVTVGGPPNKTGLDVVVTAMAFTGVYVREVLQGLVPIGPGVTTAQPFLPERDPALLFKVRDMAPAGVDYPISVDPRAARLPVPGTGLSLALPTDGSSPTIDSARAVAGPAVCARLVERRRGLTFGVPLEPPMLTLGTRSGAGRARLRLVAVDRLGNPTDPGAPITVRVVSEAPLAVAGRTGSHERTVTVRHNKGSAVTLHATGPGKGTVRVSVNGVTCQRLAFTSRPERNQRGADAVVGASRRADFATIGAAVADASDRDGDGRITIEVGEGIFRETVRLTRPVELRGAGPRRTVIDAGGIGTTLAIAAVGAEATGLTVSGGTTGISIEAPVVARDLEAWGNVGPGVRLGASGAVVDACAARENGGDGFVGEQPATVTNSLSFGNWAAGIAFRDVPGAGVAANLLAANAGDGIELTRSAGSVVTNNAVAGNLGTGIALTDASGTVLSGNHASANEANGLGLTRSDGALVDGNDLVTNDGFGMWIDQSVADFDMTLPGTQPPSGANDVAENQLGPLWVD